ncbi:MAG: permease-like cell division protein FtsX [bacterium]|nr:permease-like cell division protein FtsX [bacterium]
MNIRSLYRIIKFGLTNFWRNRWLSLAATLMMTITLLIISFFAILNLSVNTVSQTIRSRLDMEVFFFDDLVPEAKILALAQDLKGQANVKDVHFVSKAEAQENFQNYEIDPAVIQIANEMNVYPRSLKIKVNDPEKISDVSSFIKQAKYSDIVCKELKCLSSNSKQTQDTTNTLINYTRFIKRIGWATGAIFVLVSILIILNTIKLTIFTRRDEIEIMKLVGANHAFIRLPFVIEAVLYGLLATIISLGTITLIIKFTTPYISRSLKIVNLDMMRFFQDHLFQIILLQLGVSLIISIFCSVISIRTHLKT